MGYGVYINGSRPKSKKQVIQAMVEAPETVTWENDSMFGRYAGQSFTGTELPEGIRDTFVGPDPHTNRKFYGQVIVNDGKVLVK